jgi:hypothetical protein
VSLRVYVSVRVCMNADACECVCTRACVTEFALARAS